MEIRTKEEHSGNRLWQPFGKQLIKYQNIRSSISWVKFQQNLSKTNTFIKRKNLMIELKMITFSGFLDEMEMCWKINDEIGVMTTQNAWCTKWFLWKMRHWIFLRFTLMICGRHHLAMAWRISRKTGYIIYNA